MYITDILKEAYVLEENLVTILCSGVALGVYIPALLLNYQLKTNGLKTDVIVLESLYSDEKKRKILENKKAFHNNFSVAKIGHKIAGDITQNIDHNLLKELFDNWKSGNREKFIIFSGFWIPIIDAYRNIIAPKVIQVDLVHMDAELSASWRSYKSDASQYNHIWLYSWENKKILHEIRVTDLQQIPYEERENRLVIHGGGWGMGTYQDYIKELEQAGIGLDIVTYNWEETKKDINNGKFYMVDPSWCSWIKNKEGHYEFPPFGEVKGNQLSIMSNKEYHGIFDTIRKSKAIVSKPGGATLLDSLASATPIIMLEPLAKYEQANADLWEYLGFGIPYEKWAQSNFSFNLLHKLHSNLIAAKSKLIDYGGKYAAAN